MRNHPEDVKISCQLNADNIAPFLIDGAYQVAEQGSE
jgi:hypothetical protein